MNHAARRRGGGLADRGGRAAGRADAAHRRADGAPRHWSGVIAASDGVPTGICLRSSARQSTVTSSCT